MPNSRIVRPAAQSDREEMARIAEISAMRAAEKAAQAAAEAAVAATLQKLGIDASDAIAAQRRFAALQALADRQSDPDILADAQWVRDSRLAHKKLRAALWTAAAIAAFTAMCGFLWAGFKGSLTGG